MDFFTSGNGEFNVKNNTNRILEKTDNVLSYLTTIWNDLISRFLDLISRITGLDNNMASNFSAVPANVWNYSERTVHNVTFTTFVENVTNVLNSVNVSDVSYDVVSKITNSIIANEIGLKHIIIKP